MEGGREGGREGGDKRIARSWRETVRNAEALEELKLVRQAKSNASSKPGGQNTAGEGEGVYVAGLGLQNNNFPEDLLPPVPFDCWAYSFAYTSTGGPEKPWRGPGGGFRALPPHWF